MDYNNINDRLIPLSEANWDENIIPIHERGIQGRWIFDTLLNVQELRNYICDKHESQSREAFRRENVPEPDYPSLYEEFTAETLVQDHVIPWTKDIFAPLYARVPKAYTGKPTLFLSYTWKSGLFSHGYGVIYTIQRFLGSEYLWMDVFCHNQHNIGSVTRQMEKVISGIEKLILPMSEFPWYERVWCIWEVICALKNNKEIVFLEYARKQHDYKSIHKYFLENYKSISLAKTTHQKDKEEILAHVEEIFGSIEDADQYLVKIMKEYLMKE